MTTELTAFKYELKYEIRDPIHGFIRFNEPEKQIINSKPFQRLRNIHQLGMAHFVYPGANHTRFEHSLGVMEIATRMYDSIVSRYRRRFSKYDDKLGDYKQALRLAALLHDIGHGPFSHVSERILKERDERFNKHEDYTVKIIRTIFKDIFEENFDDFEFSLEDIISIIDDSNPFYEIPEEINSLLRDIINGPIDADKIDYLTRDSYYTGVLYGTFDYDTLIETIVPFPIAELNNDNEETKIIKLGSELNGIRAIEGLILARYFMFEQVYYHKTIRILEKHLTDFIAEEVLSNGNFPVDIKEYLKFNDNSIINHIKDTENESGIRILERDHFRETFSERMNEYRFKKFIEDVNDKIELPENRYIDSYKDVNKEFIPTYFLLAVRGTKTDKEMKEFRWTEISEELKEDISLLDTIFVFDKKKKIWQNIYDVSFIIKSLSERVRDETDFCRLYTDVKSKDEREELSRNIHAIKGEILG